MHLKKLDNRDGIGHWIFHKNGNTTDKYAGLSKEERLSIDTLVLSDLHLRSTASKVHAIIATLNTFWFKRIVLNGDIFDDVDFSSRLKSSHWEVISRIRTLTRPDREVTEVWVPGNHDWNIAALIASLIGIPTSKEYVFWHGERKYLVVHGHQFDSVIGRSPFITKLLVKLTRPAQLLDPHNLHAAAYVRRILRSWHREKERVANRAISYARKVGASVVICGHTHEAEFRSVDGIDYLNGGSFLENPSSFVTIDDGGHHLNMIHLK